MIIGYVRVSTEEQAKGNSIANQIARLVSWGVPLANIYSDEGVSGNNENRPGWLKVRRLLDSGTVTTLVAADLSRLHRNTKNALGFADKHVIGEGLNLVLLTEKVDLSTAAGKLQYTIVCAANQFMRDATSDKTCATMAMMRSQGLKTGGPMAPYGYRVSENGKRLVPDEHEQAGIRLMLSLKEDGKGGTEIAKALAVAGYPTKKGLKYWDPKTIVRIVEAQKVRVGIPGR